MDAVEKNEKRRLERFELNIPALIAISELNQQVKENSYTYLLTRDLSGIGVFFHTKYPLLTKTEVRIDLIIELRRSSNSSSSGFALMEATGKVVRSETAGMAVNFENHKISPIGKA